MSLHIQLSSLYSGSLINVSPTLSLPQGFRQIFSKLQFIPTRCFEHVVDVSLKYLLGLEINVSLPYYSYLEIWNIVQKIEPESMLFLFLTGFISDGFTDEYLKLIRTNYLSFTKEEIPTVKLIMNIEKLTTFLVYNPASIKHCQNQILDLIVPKISDNMKHNFWEAHLRGKNVNTVWHVAMEQPECPYKNLELASVEHLIWLLSKKEILKVKHAGIWYSMSYEKGKINYVPVCKALSYLSLKIPLTINTAFVCFDDVVLSETRAYLIKNHYPY